MAGVTKVKIEESAEELHELLRKQKTALGKKWIQALYLLKIGQVKTIQDLAVMLGKGSATVQRWLKAYIFYLYNTIIQAQNSKLRDRNMKL
ncbi:hypothetical protein WKK05_15615 [Nostoc sp. UHCC 0302]|uniref:hypothetical protein n=1 Tax=Nostoc sp. UHCC 0302 TaxID=3134896 RepID=UPI00311CB738